jgi:GH43 family beta-xylosidase
VDNDGDASRYVFVLENDSSDPLSGKWVDKGKVNTHHSGLDGSVFEHQGNRYFVYSAYIGLQSVLVISKMKNPWTLSDKQVEIARPDRDWEKFGGRQILEGPQFLTKNEGKVFIVYSASACWADEYSLWNTYCRCKFRFVEIIFLEEIGSTCLSPVTRK